MLYAIGIMLLIGLGTGLTWTVLQNFYFLIRTRPFAASLFLSLIFMVFFSSLNSFLKLCFMVLLISLAMIHVERMKKLY